MVVSGGGGEGVWAAGSAKSDVVFELTAPPDDSVETSPDTVYVARIEPVVVAAEDPSKSGRSEGIAIGGFVMDETFSVIGNDFYTAFYSAWSEPEDAEMYTVSVLEEPAPQFGARLRVEISDDVIFQTFLRPNNQKIEQAAQQAVQRAQTYLEKYHEPREVY